MALSAAGRRRPTAFIPFCLAQYSNGAESGLCLSHEAKMLGRPGRCACPAPAVGLFASQPVSRVPRRGLPRLVRVRFAVSHAFESVRVFRRCVLKRRRGPCSLARPAGATRRQGRRAHPGRTARPAADAVGLRRAGRAATNDGGTARDKAARFRPLRAEANRLGGVPLFAVLGGLGWRRTADALGPVIRDTDGRTFGMATLGQMIETEPFPSLVGRSSGT